MKRIVDEVLERTGIAHLREAYPPTLRRGEKQRVAIASALAMQSKILILDEPTSGQDGKETKELLALLRQLNQEALRFFSLHMIWKSWLANVAVHSSWVTKPLPLMAVQKELFKEVYGRIGKT